MVPDDNIIDTKLKQLVADGKLKSPSVKGNLKYTEEYWSNFVNFLSIEECDYVLSFKQEGNWNKLLYRAVEQKMNKFMEDTLLS